MVIKTIISRPLWLHIIIKRGASDIQLFASQVNQYEFIIGALTEPASSRKFINSV